MKTQRSYFGFCMVALVVAGLMISGSAMAANIMWVERTGSRQEPIILNGEVFVDVLKAAGHTVVVSNTDVDPITGFIDLANPTTGPADVAFLNSFDLIIVTRHINSGDYDDSPEEIAAWNALTPPLILMSTYLSRSSRWLWFGVTDRESLVSDVVAVIPGHPLFEGVALDGANTAVLYTSEVSHVGAAVVSAGTGEIIATLPDGRIAFAYWDTGSGFHTGSGQIAGGPRLLLPTGTNFGSFTPGVDGIHNLTADGDKVLLNAVDFMSPPALPPTPLPPSSAVERWSLYE